MEAVGRDALNPAEVLAVLQAGAPSSSSFGEQLGLDPGATSPPKITRLTRNPAAFKKKNKKVINWASLPTSAF